MESTPVVSHQHTGFFNFLPLLFSAFLVLVVVVMIEHVPVVVGKLLFCCYRFRFEREFCWVTDCSLTAVGEINNAGRLSIGRMTTKIANNFYFFIFWHPALIRSINRPHGQFSIGFCGWGSTRARQTVINPSQFFSSLIPSPEQSPEGHSTQSKQPSETRQTVCLVSLGCFDWV